MIILCAWMLWIVGANLEDVVRRDTPSTRGCEAWVEFHLPVSKNDP